MNIVDANVLLYAVNEAAERHDEARSWLDGVLNGDDPLGLSWVALLAFVRLSTKVGLHPNPLPVEEALRRVEQWIEQPRSLVVEPTRRHLSLMRGLLDATGGGGNLVNDAHLAALALEHGATVITYDNDFGRFDGVSWRSPAAPVST